MKPLSSLALTALLLTALASRAADKKEETIKLKDAPAAVQETIKKSAEGAKIKQVEKVTDGDKVIYEAIIVKGGKNLEVEVAPDGKIILMEEEVKLAECPAPVQATIKTEVGKGKITLLEKVTKDGSIYYEVEFSKDGKDLEVLIALDGKVMESKAEPAKKDAPEKK